MNNITTFETSKALIAAGFRVTYMYIGQIWYNDLGFASVIIKKVDGNFVAVALPSGEIGEGQIKSFCIPAFTATDILRELPDNYSIYSDEGTLCVYYSCPTSFQDTIFKNENISEAAALAYLSLKNK